jgi:hypothetical protein
MSDTVVLSFFYLWLVLSVFFVPLQIVGGQAKTLMFVQLNPDIDSYSETISTLKFAERVSGVELGAAQSNKEGRDVRELMEQVQSFILVNMFLRYLAFNMQGRCFRVLSLISLNSYCLEIFLIWYAL